MELHLPSQIPIVTNMTKMETMLSRKEPSDISITQIKCENSHQRHQLIKTATSKN